MFSTSFNYIYEQRYLRFPTSLKYWLFPDDWQSTVSTDAGLTVHTDLGYPDNKNCFNLLLLWIFNFFIALILWIDMQLEGSLNQSNQIFCRHNGHTFKRTHTTFVFHDIDSRILNQAFSFTFE